MGKILDNITLLEKSLGDIQSDLSDGKSGSAAIRWTSAKKIHGYYVDDKKKASGKSLNLFKQAKILKFDSEWKAFKAKYGGALDALANM